MVPPALQETSTFLIESAVIMTIVIAGTLDEGFVQSSLRS